MTVTLNEASKILKGLSKGKFWLKEASGLPAYLFAFFAPLIMLTSGFWVIPVIVFFLGVAHNLFFVFVLSKTSQFYEAVIIVFIVESVVWGGALIGLLW